MRTINTVSIQIQCISEGFDLILEVQSKYSKKTQFSLKQYNQHTEVGSYDALLHIAYSIVFILIH